MNGKLIVIEGLDGSGKSTQMSNLMQRLEADGYSIRQIKLPNYEDPSSEMVKMYLNGRFGSSPEDVNVYAASSFFGIDRFVSYNCYWKTDYCGGKIILADRYTTSNAYHQAMKLPQEDWDNYFAWLEDFEYNKLGIPKPDVVVYLDMPVEVSQKLMTERYEGDEVKKDIHEKNPEYLKKCSQAAAYACDKLGWHRITCAKDGAPLPIEEISDKIYKTVMEALI
ncbi:MAG: dTMP kinase [Acutalibacteraceae bacterium]|jgi:dTMP kinase